MTARTRGRRSKPRHATGTQPTTPEDTMQFTVTTPEALDAIWGQYLGAHRNAEQASAAAAGLEQEVDNARNTAMSAREQAARFLTEADRADADADATATRAKQARDAETLHRNVADDLRRTVAALSESSGIPHPEHRQQALPPSPVTALDAPLIGSTPPGGVPDVGELVAPNGMDTQAMPLTNGTGPNRVPES